MNWDEKCREILESFFGKERVIDRHNLFWLTFNDGASREIAFFQDDTCPELVLVLYPGANVSQARLLHKNLRHNDFLELGVLDKNWLIKRDFHIANAYRIRHRSSKKDQIPEYLKYWCNHEDKICQINATNDRILPDLLADLNSTGMLTNDDVIGAREALENCTTLRICPGLDIRYRWPLHRAEEMLRQGLLKDAVQSRASDALSAWGQEFR